tara:strand:- start:362 stop:994 length:633 start_codon:yes stop_codon:yes gene_type:complete
LKFKTSQTLLENSHSPSFVCPSCELKKNFSSVVVSRGNPFANLMIIGEAPGAMEEKLGQPFVGRSGKLLDKLLNHVGIDSQNDVYFCNVIKSRPPKNRRPTRKEIEVNLPWLTEQIYLIDPHLLILVGATAVQSVLGNKNPISRIRGTWQNWEGRLVMPLFHPSYLLRNPSKQLGAPLSLTLSDLFKVSNKLSKFKEHSDDGSRSEIKSG